MNRLTMLAVSVGLALGAAFAHAEDSPQFRGPNRDGKFADTGLLDAWPEGGPALLWEAKGLGQGYATSVIIGDTIYVPGMDADRQGHIYALGLDGEVKSKMTYGIETDDGQAPGSRSTPTIDGDRLYIVSGPGVVSCFNRASGEVLWQVNVIERFGGTDLEWDVAENLLIDGDRVICTPGGADTTVVALNKMTGETIWTSKGLGDAASYCSPIIIEHGGNRILLTESARLVVGLNPDDGAVYWTHEHVTQYDIHAVTPVYADGMIYYSGGYGSGGGMLELSPDGKSVTPKWQDTTLDCQHHGVILVDGYLYGTGHKTSELVCLELATGKIMWRTEEVTQGAVVFAESMLYVYEGPKAGIVSLVKATPEGFARTGQFEITGGNMHHWAHPAIAGKRLYIRHGDSLFAYDIAAK